MSTMFLQHKKLQGNQDFVFAAAAKPETERYPWDKQEFSKILSQDLALRHLVTLNFQLFSGCQ